MKVVNAKTLANKLDLNKPEVYCSTQGPHKYRNDAQSLARGAPLSALKKMREQGGFEACQLCFRADGGC